MCCRLKRCLTEVQTTNVDMASEVAASSGRESHHLHCIQSLSSQTAKLQADNTQLTSKVQHYFTWGMSIIFSLFSPFPMFKLRPETGCLWCVESILGVGLTGMWWNVVESHRNEKWCCMFTRGIQTNLMCDCHTDKKKYWRIMTMDVRPWPWQSQPWPRH